MLQAISMTLWSCAVAMQAPPPQLVERMLAAYLPQIRRQMRVGGGWCRGVRDGVRCSTGAGVGGTPCHQSSCCAPAVLSASPVSPTPQAGAGVQGLRSLCSVSWSLAAFDYLTPERFR